MLMVASISWHSHRAETNISLGTDFGAETETSPFSPLGLRAKIMHTWTYDQNNVHQHFRLDRLDNGNWTIKSVAYDSYLEIYSSATTSHIYHRERGERADWAPKMQEWWINWSPGGLTLVLTALYVIRMLTSSGSRMPGVLVISWTS